MPDALLHLGAMAVLVGIVYLNLDKVSSIRNAFVTDLRSLKEEIGSRFMRADVEISHINSKGKVVINSVYKNRHTHFLLCVGKLDQRFQYGKYYRFWYSFHRSFHAPCLSLIRDGWHNLPVGILTVISAFLFFNEVACSVFLTKFSLFHHQILPLGVPGWIYYWVYLPTVLLSVLFAYASHRLDGLRATCMDYMSEMDENKNYEDDLANRKRRDEIQSFELAVREQKGTESSDS